MIEETITKVKEAEAEGDARIAAARQQAAQIRQKAEDDAAKRIAAAQEAAQKSIEAAEEEITGADSAAEAAVDADMDSVLASVRRKAASGMPEAVDAVRRMIIGG